MATGTQILALAGTVSSGFLIFCLNRGLKMRDAKRPLAELLWSAGGLIPLAGVCIFLASTGDQPVTAQRVVLFIVGAAIGGFGLLAAGEYLRPATAQTPGGAPPSVIQGPGSAFSYGQTGGITAGTVYVGPQARDLNSAWGAPLKAQILKDLPRDQEISVTSIMGDAESSDLAVQIYDFLKANGFKLKDGGISQSVFIPTPHGLGFNTTTNTFVVGSK